MSESQDTRKLRADVLRKAFWDVFRGAGELWFPYERCGASTESCDLAADYQWELLLKAYGKALRQTKRLGDDDDDGF